MSLTVLSAALGAVADVILAWLRVPILPTLSRSELVFSPFILVAFLCHLRNSVVMFRLWRRLKRDNQDEELRASALERLYRAGRGMLRLLCWVGIVWALVVNWPYTLAVFTFGLLLYGVIEAVDAGLDWVYQYQRARYWERRDAMEDYAEQLGQRAEAAARRAEQVADTAAVQGTRIQEQGLRMERILETALEAIAQNTSLTKQAAEASAEAASVANHINAKLVSQGVSAAADRALIMEQQEQLRNTEEHARDDGPPRPPQERKP